MRGDERGLLWFTQSHIVPNSRRKLKKSNFRHMDRCSNSGGRVIEERARIKKIKAHYGVEKSPSSVFFSNVLRLRMVKR